MMTREGSKRLISWSIIAIVLIVVFGYALFAFRDIARGPSVMITEPVNGETYATSSVPVKGRTERVQYLALDGKSVLIDENGDFSDFILLSPGYNSAKIEARDRLGHVEIINLQLIRSTSSEMKR
ncbi:MAG: seg [Candidatus Taylorbacteria bacterium]|nr:seg [Candidatus Taylorbacteria bacterium]